MAELDTSSGGGKHKGGKVRSKKASTRVDLTAMVDLAFLLITFFMYTTTLNKPKAMNVAMPDNSVKTQSLPIAASRSMTILLGSHNKVEWYMGEPGKSAPTVDHYGKDGLRKALIDNAKQVESTHAAPDNTMEVLIKPSDKSTYENLVAALDEMKITNVQIYAIVKITQMEIDDLKKNNIY
ncbi:ExbD/TolR family protein [Mucilaginibacter gotjawali]|jgi:biopolymer transport protein ExbD|uniref:Biopolymer transport protein ExbD n=2 Tax=Mucilaginibacter gotjawali TaxID=1550579 RepID=A0A839SE53_9SPHI|nr:biopolymer transporter ExbD [Mucilaginibacter gotjawali]MBB3055170.1 biopolymer transport protein ExbD [Mucilaginibacter gotjawali]BAU56211.1 Biopolymer transport protein ExbD/TolR [Mucilaginibacter gotjawali]